MLRSSLNLDQSGDNRNQPYPMYSMRVIGLQIWHVWAKTAVGTKEMGAFANNGFREHQTV